MLDACAELLDELGYRALTTTLIAERARVPIGSVYQFFADKHELADSLAARHLGALLNRIDDAFDPERLSYPDDCSHEALPGQPPDDWRQLFSIFYDELVSAYRTEPGCRVLHLGTDPTLWSPDTRPHPHDVIIDHLTAYFEKYPHLTEIPEWTRLGVRWGVEILHALVTAAFRADPTATQESSATDEFTPTTSSPATSLSAVLAVDQSKFQGDVSRPKKPLGREPLHDHRTTPRPT